MFGRDEPPDPASEGYDSDVLDAVRRERRAALADPGPSWREWFLYSGSKWWIGLGFLIVDAWVITSWFDPFDPVGMVVSLAACLYLEYLAYGYLWYRPAELRPMGSPRFRPTWYRLREFGRWTPEEAEAGAGQLHRPQVRRDDF